MNRAFFLSIFLLIFLSFQLLGQRSIKDSSIYTPLIGISYGYQISAGDLAERFGNNFSVGLNFDFKTRKNWLFGVNANYLFGQNIKEKLFQNISTSSGNVIGSTGTYSEIRLQERGYTVLINAGKLLPLKRVNPNSGPVFSLGLGFIQHKIKIETVSNDAPQLSNEYKKGYDRLTNGLLLSQNLGYLHLSDNRMVNFYAGFECMQGFTQNRRSYDYDLMKQDTKKRLDILYGVKLVWLLPLYTRAPKEFYTY